jgi:hypothetical protein
VKRLLIIAALFCAPIYAAQLPCTITIDTSGNASAACTGTINPPIPTTPVPLPPVVIPAPSGNVIQHDLLSEGSNNYVFDGDKNGQPLGSIQALRLPLRTSDGRTINAATFNFTDYIVYTPSTLQVEIAFSPTAGDFTYYKSAAFRFFSGQQPYYPCGGIFGPVATLSHAPEAGYDACAIPPGAQWFLNWRVVDGCEAGRGFNCGQVLIWHRTY